MNTFTKLLIVTLSLINLYGLVIMYIDKHRAIHKKWRIPEAKLFTIAFFFGSLGILLGMFFFHHKTKHLKFLLGIPLLLLLQLYLFYKLSYLGI